jgi:large subunit ribosomal protein L22
MTGPKLNEKSTVAGERRGTRASARYVRMSASKARVVLDLIRDLPVRNADEVLQLTEREAAREVRKVLASAVANAVNNDDLDADALFVVACYADEGPTLKRFRPRARGRAGRINKRTCHITVIVDTMSDERLAIVEARAERGGRSRASTDRRARVERSRQRAAQRAGATDESSESVENETVEDLVEETEVVETEVVETEETPAEVEATEDVEDAAASDDGDEDAKKDEV